jgi:hypothetical protein
VALKSLLDRAARHLLFLAQSRPHLCDRWGYHIRPIHYYEPLPDFRSVTTEQITRRREFPGVDFSWSDQLALLKELVAYQNELNQINFNFENGFFSGFDAAVYYSMIRHLKPRRIIEIGGGYSTLLADKALLANGSGSLTCIDPYPERLAGAGPKIELVQKQVEKIDVNFFSCLAANDILFIDSSHTVKFGSDVCYEFLEILPRLAPGVWVHVHDIFFPHDYPAEWLIERRLALNEQYLLQAFLSFNCQFQVTLSNYWLYLDHPDQAMGMWRSAASRPSSLWLKRST